MTMMKRQTDTRVPSSQPTSHHLPPDYIHPVHSMSNDNRQTMPSNSNKIHIHPCSGRTSTSTTRAKWINIRLFNSSPFRLIYPYWLVLGLASQSIERTERFVDAYRWIQLTLSLSLCLPLPLPLHRQSLCGHSAEINYRSDYIDIIFPSIN